MSISLFIVALVPLLMAPLYTYNGYQDLYEREAAHLAVDNAGILLGKNDREIFNQIIRSNKFARVLEVTHHVAHFASKVPVIGLAFKTQDKALEAAIEINHIETKVLAELAWKQGSWKVLSEFARFKISMERLERNSRIPIEEKRCGQCGATPYWEISSVPVRSKIIGKSNAPDPYVFVEMAGSSLLRGGRWNYKMFLE